MLRVHVVVAVLSLLTFAESAFAQSRGGTRGITREEFLEMMRQRSASRSRSAQPTAPVSTARGGTEKTRTPPTGPQVDIEVLFLEVTSVGEAKKPFPKLSGDAATVRKALAEMKKNGQLKTESRYSLSAIDGQKAMTQTSGSVYIVRSIADARRRGGFPGGTSRSYSSRSYGTVVTVTPTVEKNGSVVLQMQIEKSWPEGATDAGAEAGESVPPTTIKTSTISATTRVASGAFVVLSSTSKASKNGVDRIVVLASATVTRAPADERKVSIFKLKSADATKAADVIEQLISDRNTTIVADARTNSIIAKGETKVLKTIEAILQRIDAEPPK